MVCSNHFKSKYVRFLIKYHLFIFCSILIMTSISIGLLIYKHDQIHFRNLLRGFQAHGTKSSDEYRKLIALLRETQITHLFPHSINSETFQQTPYATFHPHIDPCSKRFHLSTCPILPYTELNLNFNQNSTILFDDIDTFQSICQLEWHLRSNYTTCSTTSCCEYIGPVDLFFNGEFQSLDQCKNITINQLKEYYSQWLLCNISECLNTRLHDYLKHFDSKFILKIYINIPNDLNQRKNLIDLYDYVSNYQYKNKYQINYIKLNSNNEQILFNHFLYQNLPRICLSICLYILCLLLFIKNLFFILIILQHIYLTLICTFSIYIYFLKFPLTILNYTSIILYLFLILIDSFLWYTCWFINNHRRDDCTINRMIENLLTQTFYYILPKNLAAIIILVITYTNQIIALQCFTVFSFLLILISFFISFTLYPASFILILRYQSTIPNFEHFLHRILTIRTTNCFIDRTIPCLIVRLKAFWLILLSLITCISFIIIFQWPKLEFNVCQIAFDTLPYHLINDKTSLITKKTFDIDITYYIGSHWEVPNESIIPYYDIPMLSYNHENKITTKPGTIQTFEYALEKNLSQLIQFCSQLKIFQQKQINNENNKLTYKHYQRHIHTQILNNNNNSIEKQLLTINHIHCFGDLTPIYSSIPLINTTFSSIIINHYNESINCTHICNLNQTSNTYECIKCLNSLYYNSYKLNDLFLIKNGLRFISDSNYPRYLFQTINYEWNILTNLNNYLEWKLLNEYLKNNFIQKFYSNTFTYMSTWWSSELFSTYTIMEQLEQEKYVLIGIKFIIILIFLVLFTGVLGVFVTLTTLCNYLTSIAILTLLNYKLTIENMSYFTIVLIISSQYSVLYSISYKLAPTFFFQRENRTMYSLKQLCTTLFHLTFSIILIFSPCLFSSLLYLFKIALIFIISSLISLIYSTFFLQSLLCYIGPADHKCFFFPCHCKLTHQLHANKNDLSLRKFSTTSRRHQRMSTSSYFQSSYFSQIFTGSTYFESEYGGLNDTLTIGSRRRESSRSHQISHAIKRNSLLTGELIELYTPRASLAPYGHYLHHNRYGRQSSVPRGVPTTGPARPLYVSPSISPYSQLSIHSQVAGRQRSPSPHTYRPSRSPSPHSFIRLSSTTAAGTSSSLRPCYSAPRLHVPIHRTLTNNLKQTDISTTRKRSMMIIQRQDAISSTEDYEQLSAETKRNMLKETTTESTGPVWLKRSNSS